MILAIFVFSMLAMLAVGLVRVAFAYVPYYTGIIITNWRGTARAAGPGMQFVLPVFESAGESVSLKEKIIDDKMDAETSEEEVVNLDYSIEYWPLVQLLVTFIGFTQDQIESAIKQRVKSLLSIEVRALKTRDDVYEKLEEIAGNVERKFHASFAAQYGVGLRFMIDDPDLPKELAEAEVKREIAVKDGEKREIEMRATNRIRHKEMKKLQLLAAGWVKESKDSGSPMDFQTAMETIQTQLKVIAKTSEVKGYNRDTLNTVEKVLPGLAKELFGRGASPEEIEKLFRKIIKEEVLDGRK